MWIWYNKVDTKLREFRWIWYNKVDTKLREFSERGLLYGKKKLLLSAFGVGMTWATGIVPFVDCKISDIVEI